MSLIVRVSILNSYGLSRDLLLEKGVLGGKREDVRFGMYVRGRDI